MGRFWNIITWVWNEVKWESIQLIFHISLTAKNSYLLTRYFKPCVGSKHLRKCTIHTILQDPTLNRVLWSAELINNDLKHFSKTSASTKFNLCKWRTWPRLIQESFPAPRKSCHRCLLLPPLKGRQRFEALFQRKRSPRFYRTGFHYIPPYLLLIRLYFVYISLNSSQVFIFRSNALDKQRKYPILMA